MTTSPDISITFDGLDAGQQQAVTRFMQAAAQAFEDKNPHALAAMQHAGASESGQRNTFDYNQGLMEGGDRIVSWSASPYKEPRWSIMKLYQHHPEPTVWVLVMLDDGRRQTEYCFALAPTEDGGLKSCYYIDRVKKNRAARRGYSFC